MPMDWKQLLCDDRMPKEGKKAEPAKKDVHRTPFEGDYDRIVYCAPFRRLARKTQVHPFAENDHIHNRLTHSIEVASVGRSFARRLGAFLCKRKEIQKCQINDLCYISQAACLAHDIGNPPFGHAGEFAIRAWVQNHDKDILSHNGKEVSPGLRQDLTLFEGNAQGFRLAARMDNPRGGYMRLTFATLGAMIKYPWDSLDDRARERGKFSVFSSERDLFLLMTQELGMVQNGKVARHPLSFLTEAADDICYRTLDLEDAVDMGILKKDEVRQLFRMLLPESDAELPIPVMRGKVISHLIDQCWSIFEHNYDAVMAGTREKELKADLGSDEEDFLEKVKEHYERIFAHRTKVAVELGAYEVLGRIIKALGQATQELSKNGDFAKVDFLNQRRLELAWGREYVERNVDKSYEWWLHQVMDYVSGLTDNYAKQVSAEIAGL